MSGECVRVMVRCRPMNSKEKQNSSKMCVQVDQNTNQITLLNSSDPNDNTKIYTYDSVFAPESSQQYIYEQSAFQLVESVFEGYNGTIFAYGQTGCGKTFTMMGEPSNEEMKGIVPRTFQHIINVIESEGHKEFLVRCSYIEIYNEEIHDLLSKDVKAKYELKESPDEGVFIKDLNKKVVKSVSEMEQLMNVGNKNRSTGETAMNKDSSRSHSIFTIYVEVSEMDSQGEQHFRAGKLNLVDLAGSERQSKTQATGDRLKEANKINLSLSALGNVISALVDGKSQHVPYRDSKLTRLLQDSLGGNTKTIMIAAISPSDYNYEETIGTLRYASRAKKIKNKPKINEDPKDALLREYADEINKLKMQLQNGGGGRIDNGNEGESAEKWKEANEMLNKDRERMEKELKDKQEIAEKEKEQRLQMEKLLEEYQKNKLVGGKGGDEEEKKAYQEMKKNLKNQQKEHEKLVQENKRKEEEMLEVEKNYQNLQEEVEAQRKIIKKLKAKCKQNQSELEDLINEKNDDKEELLSTVRIFEKENQLSQAILDMAFKKEEIDLIKTNTEWSDVKNRYVVVPFLFKNKELRLPKLPFGQAMEQIENEKESRVLYFEKNTIRDTSPMIKNKKESGNNNPYLNEYFVEENSSQKKSRKPDNSISRSKQGQKRSLIDVNNNISSQIHQFSTGNYGGIPKEEEIKPKRNINGIQLNPLTHNTAAPGISPIIIRNTDLQLPHSQQLRRNPKKQALAPLNMQHSNSKSVES